MDTIARTKADISVLRKDILPVSPFGMLSQAFTEEILGRFESGPGMYPMYGLELLYPMENAGEALVGGNVHLEVQLKLILQQLKESGRTPAAERILEKAETLRLLREKTAVRWMSGTPGKAAAHRNPVAMGQPPSAGSFMLRSGGIGITRSQSGARYMTVHTGIGRMNKGSYWPGMYAESAMGMENRQPGTHIGTASGGNEKRPSAYTDAALARMGAPTVAGLPGQMGLSLAKVQFLMPQETEFSGRQPMEHSKAAAGLTRQMEQAAAQAAEAVAKVVATDSKGADHHRRVGRVPSNAERSSQRSDRLSTEQTHWEAGKNTTEDGVAANHAFAGMTAEQGSVDVTVTGGETASGQSFPKERPDGDLDTGRFGSTIRDIRTGGGHTGRLPDTELTTNGAAGHMSALRQDKVPDLEGGSAASGYLPMSLEHMGPVDVPEQAIVSGRMSTFNETERQLARMIETAAFAAERPLTQTVGEARGKRDPIAERKSETYGDPIKTLAGKTAAPVAQATGMGDANALQTMQMKQAGPLVKGWEETVESETTTVRRDRPAASGPGVLHDLEKLAVSRTAGDLANTHNEADSGPVAERHISTELAGQPPLTLEYLQELQKNDIQAAEQALSPKVLEKLLDTPGMRLLSKDIAVLVAERRESRQISPDKSQHSPRKGQPPYRLRQSAQGMTGHVAQAGWTPKGMTVGDVDESAAGHTAVSTKPLAAGQSAVFQRNRVTGMEQSRSMGTSPVRGSGDMTAVGMTAASTQSHTRSLSVQAPVELAYMEPSLEVQTAGQTVARQRLGVQQETLLKEIQRSLAASKSSIVGSGQNTAQSQAQAKQIASGRKTAVSPMQAGQRGFARRGLGQLTALKPLGAFPRGTGTILNAVQGAAAQGEIDQETTSAYPVLSMEYGGPLLAMAKELRQTAERELGQSGAAREMGLHTPAARAIEEKGSPETMRTLDLMTQPQIQAQQVVWENPYMRSAPAEITHHQKNNPQNQQRTQQSQPQIRMSDAEIRRTADKVFKLVQEKIVTERRRIGRM